MADDAASDGASFGPALPPELVASRAAARGPIGPAMPAWLRQGRGPAADDTDEVVGPLPPPASGSSAGPSAAEDAARVAREIEDRAAKFRSKLTDVAPATEETKTRADWMLKPPEYEVAGDQLRARGFNQRKVPVHDSSGWTETPADRARKAEDAKRRHEEGDTPASKKRRDAEDEQARAQRASAATRQQVDEYNKQHRAHTLMDEYHRQHLPSKLAATEETERLPFDRDRDLQVRRIDHSKRRQFIAQAGELKTRFGPASGASYL